MAWEGRHNQRGKLFFETDSGDREIGWRYSNPKCQLMKNSSAEKAFTGSESCRSIECIRDSR